MSHTWHNVGGHYAHDFHTHIVLYTVIQSQKNTITIAMKEDAINASCKKKPKLIWCHQNHHRKANDLKVLPNIQEKLTLLVEKISLLNIKADAFN